jgi:hypothetical protein
VEAPVPAGDRLAGAYGRAVQAAGDARVVESHRASGGVDDEVDIARRGGIQVAGSGRCGAEGATDAKVTQVSLTVCGRQGPDG